ncbi:MAG: TetR/AcrR family transcriptional regulator [Deltaproteobacteria bacterium]|nr:TetR/AcrR family transcriptional regulator [Deltaproteobacteria bacterium]
MAAATRVRRTQQERREATIRKLLDATTEALIDQGYADASVQEICERAGISQGGLFRHFASREALMVAVGRDVGEQLLQQYRREFESLRSERDPLRLGLELVRKTCRSRLNQAWYELAMAARTRPRLRKALAPLTARYHADIGALARELLPELALALGPTFDAMVGLIVAVFDGEAWRRFVLRDAAGDDARLELLHAATTRLTGL